jgi:hypothetical protein
MTGMARLGGTVCRVGLGLILAVGLGTAVGVLVGGPAFASGETGGSPTEPGTSPTGTGTSPTGAGTSPTGTGTSNCPSFNPPNQLTLVAGTPQTAILQSAFATGLQVALTNSNGCPVTSAAAGVPVTFSAPSRGAGGVFSTSGSNTVTVGADAAGSVAAPALTANTLAGSYTVVASSQYGSVSFSLTNTAAGVWCSTLDGRAPISAGEPVKLTTGVGATQSTTAGTTFPIRLAVTVTDAEKHPVGGAEIAFSAPTRGASGRFTLRSSDPHRHRSHLSHPRVVEVETNACGIAVAPTFIANHLPGGYIVKASVEHARPAAFALVNEAPGQSE